MADTIEIRLPRLADAVTTVRFGAWLKQDGDRVEAGEPVAEVETDKTTVELEAPAAGVLCDLRVAPGADGLEAGAVLGRIAPAAGVVRAAAPSVPDAGAAQAAAPPAPAGDARPAASDEAGPGRSGSSAAAPSRGPVAGFVDTAPAQGVGRATRDAASTTPGGAPAVLADPPAGSGGSGDVPAVLADPPAVSGASPAAPAEAGAAAPAATPLARRMAVAANLDLSGVRAAYPDGRIRKTDIDRELALRRGAPRQADALSAPGVSLGDSGGAFGEGAASGKGPSSGPGGDPTARGAIGRVSPPAPPVPPEAGVPPGAEAPHREQPLTAMRRVTATRMQQAKQTVPHFYLRTECRVDAALQFLAAAKRERSDAPTLTDLVVRAAASALRAVPEANSAWVDGVVRVYERVDIAVAVDTPQGLVAPVVRGADGKDLGAIARETRVLAARAREGRLAPGEYAGGTFTVSNLGMYGVESLYAIVNPPQSCILGVGAATRRPVADGDRVGVGTVMACTLSADHRVLDGAVGARLLAALKSRLEQPGLMLLQTEEVVPPAGR